MPRIPVYTVDTAPEDSRDPLKALEAKFGKVLNIHGEMAHSPVVLQSYTALQNVITNYGTFGPAPAKPSPSPWATSTTAATASPRTPWQARRPD
jgi:hypothetical protein